MATKHMGIDFNTLVQEHGKRIFNVAYRIVGNRQDAEDVTQNTFLRAHEKLDQFKGASTAFTWLYRIAVNESLKYKRVLTKRYIDSLDETILAFKDDLPEDVKRWQTSPEERYIYEELLSEVQNACFHFITFRLTDEQRIPYVLRTMFGFTLDEIASILDVSKNTVKARLQRAKSGLYRYFSGRCQWADGDSSCSCESRLGFALTSAPEIIRRLRNHPLDENTKNVMKHTLRTVGDIDDVYRNLPHEKIDPEFLNTVMESA